MLLWVAVLTLNCVSFANQEGFPEDKTVSYSCYQVWTITTRSSDEYQLVLRLKQLYGRVYCTCKI